MEQPGKLRGNVRFLIAIVSLPFWALLAFEMYSIWLGDSYTFDGEHVLVVLVVYVFFRVVVLGKRLLPAKREEKQ